MSNIKVGIIEDDSDFAQSLMLLVNGSQGFECKHVFETAEKAIDSIPELNLDVVLTDINLPETSGIECIKKLKPKCEKTQFIICSVFDDTENILKALKAGATGYITKSTQPAKILEAITEVYNGGSPMNNLIARKVINSFQEAEKTKEFESLSNREQQILDLLATGLRYKEISDVVFLSVETVRTHIRNIYKKLEVNSKKEAISKIFNK